MFLIRYSPSTFLLGQLQKILKKHCYYIQPLVLGGTGLIHYHMRRLIIRSRKASKGQDRVSKCLEIWLVPQQHCCRDAWQISELLENFNHRSRVFKASRDLKIRTPGKFIGKYAYNFKLTWHGCPLLRSLSLVSGWLRQAQQWHWNNMSR